MQDPPYTPPYKMNILKARFCPKDIQHRTYPLYFLSLFFGWVAAASFLFVLFLCGKQG